MQDLPYRIAVVLIVVVVMPIAVYHRLQARSGEKISHREEGYLFATVLRLTGMALWLSLLAWLVYPPAVQWAALPLPAAVRWLGVALGMIAAALMYWTLRSLGKNLTDTVVTRRNATLVTSGPYRWVRHPFYVTAALLMLAVTLLSASGLIAASSLAALGLLAFRTPKEEQMLLARFGSMYSDYMAVTGRYLPKFGRR